MIFSSFHKKQNKELNKGFSLLEVLVAIIILGLVATPILRAFVTSARLSSDSRKKQIATAFATNVCETMKGYDPKGFDGGNTTINGDDYTVDSATGNDYSLTVRSSEYDDYEVKLTVSGKSGFVKDLKEVKDISPFCDAIFEEDPGLTIQAYNEICADIADWLNTVDEEYVYTAQDVKNSFRGDFTVKREVKCTVSASTVTMTITFRTQADSVPYHRLSGVTATGNPGVADKTVTLSEPVIFNNSATGAPLERVYLYYYPAYSNYNATGYEISEDKIVIENNSGSEDINFYLVKQIEHTNRNLATSEATYTPVVSLSSAGTGNEVLFHNLNQDISGTGVPGGFTISGCTAKTFDELVEEKEEVLVYDLDIKVFKKSDPLTCVFELKGTR